MNTDQGDALIGQLAADSVVRDALLIALIEHHPAIRSAIAAKVAAVAPGVQLSLPETQAAAFHGRVREVLAFPRDA
jgi:hypothetical protein